MYRNESYQAEFHAVYQSHVFNFNSEANHSSEINEPLVKFGIFNDVQMLSHAVTPTWCVQFWRWSIFMLRTSGISLRTAVWFGERAARCGRNLTLPPSRTKYYTPITTNYFTTVHSMAPVSLQSLVSQPWFLSTPGFSRKSAKVPWEIVQSINKILRRNTPHCPRNIAVICSRQLETSVRYQPRLLVLVWRKPSKSTVKWNKVKWGELRWSAETWREMER
jgi:hypothetical protein